MSFNRPSVTFAFATQKAVSELYLVLDLRPSISQVLALNALKGEFGAAASEGRQR